MDKPDHSQFLAKPPLSLKKLSFCHTNTKGLHYWLDSLSKSDNLARAQNLTSAIDELSQLRCKDKSRLEWLELIQAQAHSTLKQLQQQHLGLANSSPQKAKQIYQVQQSLQQKLVYGFSLCAQHAAQNMQRLFGKPSSIFSKAILHALNETRAILLSCYQQYQFDLPSLWQHGHALYQLSLQYPLANDEQAPLVASYKHLLLWGCTNAHQINQLDFKLLDQLFSAWQVHVEITFAPNSRQYAYFIARDQSGAPVSGRLFQGQAYLALNFSPLVAYINQPEANQELREAKISTRLLAILAHSWGSSSDRVFERINKRTDVMYATGLRASHYFLGHQQSLAELLKRHNIQQANADHKASFTSRRSISEQLDPWQQSVFGTEYRSEAQSIAGDITFKPQNEYTPQETSSYAQLKPAQATVLDASPAGYQLQLAANESRDCLADVGNLILVKEEHHSHWDLAVIRWLKQGQRRHVGVELFQPGVIACAIAPSNLQAEVTNNYMHALLLPEHSANDGSRIIVPANMLKSGQWAYVLSDSSSMLIKLGKSLASNNYFGLFDYEERPAQQAPLAPKNNSKTTAFSTMWEIL